MKVKRNAKVTIKLELSQEEFNTIVIALGEITYADVRKQALKQDIGVITTNGDLYEELATWMA